MAPTVSMEQLIYDCRLMNEAAARGFNLKLRDLLADSDSRLDVQAYVLRPDVVLDISKELVKAEGHYARSVAAARLTIDRMKKAAAEGKVSIPEREKDWLDTMEAQLDTLPQEEEKFIEEMVKECESEKFAPAKYDL